jgi:hypothetical protein
MPVIGDPDGAVSKALVAALSERGEVVELDGEEPSVASTEAAQLGRERNAGHVVMAQVERSEVMLGRAEITLHGRLIRSSDGAIVKAATVRQVYQTHVGRYRWVLAAVVAAAALILAALVLPRLLRGARRAIPGQATAMRERELQSDERLRERTTREVGGCLQHLKTLADRAVASGEGELHGVVQQLRGEIDLLRMDLEKAPFGHHPELAKAGVNERDLRGVAEVEGRIFGMVQSVHRELRSLVGGDAPTDVSARLEQLRLQVSDIRDRCQDRKDVLAGLTR